MESKPLPPDFSHLEQLNQQGLAVCHALSRTFDVPTLASSSHIEDGTGGPLVASPVTVGIEVEVPFSSFFPDLWAAYGLDRRHMGDLSPQERQALSTACTLLEDDLCPRLFKTTECGIPRGADRYWEFAHRPVADARILVEQVRLLTAAGLLPRDKPHSLHVTLGNLPRTESLYHLTMLAEAMFVDPHRITRGIDQVAMRASRQELLAGWGKKGSSGLYEKPGAELEGGSAVGVEIRVLQLPTTDAAFSRLMGLIQWGADGIYDRRHGLQTQAAEDWGHVAVFCRAELARCGLPNVNWFKSGPSGRVDEDAWRGFTAKMPEIGERATVMLEEMGLWDQCDPSRLEEQSVCMDGECAR